MVRQQTAKYVEWEVSFFQMGLVVLKTAWSLLAVDWQIEFRCMHIYKNFSWKEWTLIRFEITDWCAQFLSNKSFGDCKFHMWCCDTVWYKEKNLQCSTILPYCVTDSWQSKPQRQPQRFRLSIMTFQQAAKHFLGYCQLVKSYVKIPCSMPPHIRHFDHIQFLKRRHVWLLSTCISCFNLSPGTKSSRIWCSTFVWQFYLKDMVLFLPCAICHLKFHPYQPEALEPSLAMFLRPPWLPMDGQPWGNQIK